jgi:predicted LPLAT superfamily acyltransferase
MSDGWRQRPEAGSRSGLRLLVWLALNTGRTAANLILLPVSVYFLLVRRAERRASKDFLQRLGEPTGWLRLAKHFYTFARVTLDRIYLISGRGPKLDVEIDDSASIIKLLDDKTGFVLIGSHLGSIEASRAVSFTRPDVNLRILLDRGISRNTSEMLDALNPKIAGQIIDASQAGGTPALQMGEALAEGSVVAMVADRLTPGERSIVVDFLGQPAAFPLGPFLLAHAMKVPVYLFFGLYLGGCKYRVVFEEFEFKPTKNRKDRMRNLESSVQAYARRIEYFAKQYPLNWFNFYDFWKLPESTDKS